VGATVLTETGHEGTAYELTGPQAVTFSEIADVLSDALGHDVSYVQLSEADQRGALSEMGMPAPLVDGFVDLLQWANGGDAAVVTTDVEAVTGTPATPLETFVGDHVDAFRAT
jgi:uncharacterized protein YbjT (DUF2867 family)